MSAAESSLTQLVAEAKRQLVICNACRYCEGYCPVFRAIETRRDFKQGDVLYLANLCHDCRACYYACMYAPPHQFAINIPQVMSQVRIASYRRWSWPEILGRAFSDRRFAVLLGTATAVVVILLAAFLIAPQSLLALHTGAGAFYRVVPYPVMVIGGLALAAYAAAVWLRGGSQFRQEAGGILAAPGGFKALMAAIGNGLTLRHYRGGGPGCTYPDERPSSVRRILHLLVYWGFLSAFLSTTLAFIYQDMLGLLPPYAVSSAPVIFGTLGGLALVAGTTGLIWIKAFSDAAPAGRGASTMDYIFLGTLNSAALTGLLTLILRSTLAMGTVLVIHLASVAALFLTAPYGKFVHALYRTLALVRYHAEEKQIDAGGMKQAAGH